MKFIIENESEIGIHASYFAYKSENMFAKEKALIENSCGQIIYGNIKLGVSIRGIGSNRKIQCGRGEQVGLKGMKIKSSQVKST